MSRISTAANDHQVCRISRVGNVISLQFDVWPVVAVVKISSLTIFEYQLSGSASHGSFHKLEIAALLPPDFITGACEVWR